MTSSGRKLRTAMRLAVPPAFGVFIVPQLANIAMAGRLRSWYLCYWSKPKGLRPLYKLLRKQRIRRIVELGIGSAERTLRMLELCPATEETSYAGIDLFEARENGDGAGMPLKQAHKLLATTGAKTRLIPGDPYSALARAANSLARQDLVLISADQDAESLARAWFYVPRMLHASTVVLHETRGEDGPVLTRLTPEEIAKLAQSPRGRRAA